MYTRKLLAQRVEFLFIVGVPQPEPLNRLCAAAGVPCVNVDLPGYGAPSIVSDNRGGARRLTDMMIGKVRRRGGSLKNSSISVGSRANMPRTTGWRALSRRYGTQGVEPGPDCFALCGYPPERAREGLKTYVERHGQLPSGLFINSIAAFEGAIGLRVRAASRDVEPECCELL